MTTNEVKKMFLSIRKEQNEIAHILEIIKAQETLLLPQAIRYDKDKVQTSPEDKFSEICARITDLQAEMANSIDKLKQKQIQAEKLLMQLDNSDEREVMRWYYMTTEDGKLLTWEQVAIRMNFYKRHVLRLHGNAIKELSELG